MLEINEHKMKDFDTLLNVKLSSAAQGSAPPLLTRKPRGRPAQVKDFVRDQEELKLRLLVSPLSETFEAGADDSLDVPLKAWHLPLLGAMMLARSLLPPAPTHSPLATRQPSLNASPYYALRAPHAPSMLTYTILPRPTRSPSTQTTPPRSALASARPGCSPPSATTCSS